MNEDSPCCGAPEGLSHAELARVAKALSDPIRLGMLDIMSQGRSCCQLPDPASRGVPGAKEPQGICVCEFQEQFGLGQSKVSYHLHVLRTVREVRNAIGYVLNNARRHLTRAGRAPARTAQVDPASSGAWFLGWRPGVPLPRAIGPPPVARAMTWLARVGWRRLGLLDPAEI